MSLSLKKVTDEDCCLLFKWANDADVRKNAFNTKTIKFEEHLKWFNNKINSDNFFMFICYDKQLPVGQIRLDIEEDKGIIDYSIDKKYRGNGYGTKILGLIEKEIILSNIKIVDLIGEVKYSNIGSQKAFEKNNYKKIEKKDFIYYSKVL